MTSNDSRSLAQSAAKLKIEGVDRTFIAQVNVYIYIQYIARIFQFLRFAGMGFDATLWKHRLDGTSQLSRLEQRSLNVLRVKNAGEVHHPSSCGHTFVSQWPI